jgi:membrane associated rhomboid family serine protease
MIFPLAHENMRGRRWPVITIALIALNTLIFLGTHSAMQQQLAETGDVEIHVVLLNAAFPDAPMTPAASEIVQSIKLDHPGLYEQLSAPHRTQFVDLFDQRIHSEGFRASDAETQMNELCAQLAQTQASSIAWNYAFHSVHPFPWTYITATFLHGGWLHLIFNMWFLWLAGIILEDLWGRVIYPIFFLVAGALAWAVQGAVYPHSIIPALGASGAIAGLMGAFLARFPTTKIRLGWLIIVRVVKFNVPAYVILPLWLAIQVFWGMLSRTTGAEAGVAYWAHIGGFAFGALGAFLLRTTGIEHSAHQAIEAKVSWTADPLIVQASDALAEDKPAAAVATLQRLVQEQPDSIDGWDLLLRAQERTQDHAGQKETVAVLCRLHVLAGEMQSAAADYESYKNLGGTELPRGIWLELCRYYEREKSWEQAIAEYEKLAQANPTARAGVTAVVSAGQICLAGICSPERAEKFFKAAEASPAPHSDLDAAIQEGLKKCAAAAATQSRVYTR